MFNINGKAPKDIMINGKFVLNINLDKGIVYRKTTEPPSEYIPAQITYQATVGTNTLYTKVVNGTTIKNDCFIDWGDGSKTSMPLTGGNITHNYDIEDVYTITISGTSFAGFNVNNQAEKGKYLSFISMGKWENDILANINNMLYGCNNLININQDSLKYLTNITSLQYTFRGCTSLISVPEDLFRYNSLLTSFNQTFYGCTSLQSIPVNLFKYNTEMTGAGQCFYQCTSLIEIPEDLFKYNEKLQYIDGTFALCNKITVIPSNLFRYNLLLERIGLSTSGGCFQSCTGISTLPQDLFKYNENITSIEQCFQSCSSLVTLPSNLFAYNLKINNSSRCFYGCTALQLRNDIFGLDYINRFNGKNVTFTNCFYRTTFTGTKGIAPELWNFIGLTGIKTTCFGGAGNDAISLSNYSSIPTTWK